VGGLAVLDDLSVGRARSHSFLGVFYVIGTGRRVGIQGLEGIFSTKGHGVLVALTERNEVAVVGLGALTLLGVNLVSRLAVLNNLSVR